MPIPALLLAAQPVFFACRPSQLRLSLSRRDGDFNGMSHSGTELSIRNLGPDCTLPALPTIGFRDARGRTLQALRRVPVGMHPGPVMVPVRLAAGHRATANLRWVSGPVYPHSRSIRAATITVRFNGSTLRAPIAAVLYGEAGKPVLFNQTPLRSMEGMAAD
jgi:hypothetical protein